VASARLPHRREGRGAHAVPNRSIDLLWCAWTRAEAVVRLPGEVELRLEPWPELQLRFTGLPELPAGVVLQVAVQGPSNPAARYMLGGSSGRARSLLASAESLQPRPQWHGIRADRRSVHRLSLFLAQRGRNQPAAPPRHADRNRRWPRAARGPRLAEEVERAVAQLQASKGGEAMIRRLLLLGVPLAARDRDPAACSATRCPNPTATRALCRSTNRSTR
jgi:hypothetical protein